MQATTPKKTSKQIEWEYRLARFATSGGFINEFCQAEGVSVANFYRWRKLLSDSEITHPQDSGFIEVGTLPLRQEAKPIPQCEATTGCGAGALSIRLDLGNGLVLHIERR